MLKMLHKLIPEKSTSEREQQSAIQLLRTLVIVSLIADLGALILVLAGGFGPQYSVPIAALLIFAITSFVLLQRGILLPAQIILPTTLYFVVTYIVSVGYGLHDINLIAFSVVIILASLTLGQGAALGFACLIILTVFAIAIGEMRGVLVSPTSSLTLPVSPFAVSVVILAITFIQRALINQLNQNVRRARDNERAQIQANTELRELQANLEQRVEDRTGALEKANSINRRRASQFEALAQVTQAINSIRGMEELLPRVTEVISEQFGYYHVGIFLNGEDNQFTYLTATNSEGGRRMLEHGHNLKIGKQGIVGSVAASGNPLVARKVGEDAVYFNNPELPETQSEIALPLRSGGAVVGVLDVQSRSEDAFTPDDISVLTILADQVSVAIDNTRLYETTRRSLEDAEGLYREYVRQAWSRLPRERQMAGFRYTPRGAYLLETPLELGSTETAEGTGEGSAEFPITLRGETIGHLKIQVPEGSHLGQDQMELIQAVAERVALSAENARLFDETSRRAERERLVTEITSKIRTTNDPQTMIQTALDELRSALGATQVQLIPQSITVAQNPDSEIVSSTPPEMTEKAPRGNGAKL